MHTFLVQINAIEKQIPEDVTSSLVDVLIYSALSSSLRECPLRSLFLSQLLRETCWPRVPLTVVASWCVRVSCSPWRALKSVGPR